MGENRDHPAAAADPLCEIPDCAARFEGPFRDAVGFILTHQLLDADLWALFVRQFRAPTDTDGGWRCEYWGKMMRGACFIYSCTGEERLYALLSHTVRDLLSTQDAAGRFSTYPAENEFRNWDVWGRKYVMLGLLYFLEICREEDLCAKILTALRRHADYICARLGRGEGKRLVCETSDFWLGANSLSILEPFVLLCRRTGEPRYLAFAREIVREGYEEAPCIFRLAEEDRLDPCEYPETKAYETMSCFDGLAEYARLTGETRYRDAALRFGRRLLSSDVTVIGCCGCTHELFDRSVLTQVDDAYQNIMQETCVTVTLIKLCAQLLRLSGDVTYADCMETAFFNAYLGALNTEGCPSVVPEGKRSPRRIEQVLPFDSYSPLRDGVRGRAVGGLCVMEEGSAFYGCCACIGSAGAGCIPKAALLSHEKGLLLNFYLPGEISGPVPGGGRVRFAISGNYPYEGAVRVRLSTERPETFALDLRIPAWSGETEYLLNGERGTARPGRHSILRRWQDGDELELFFNLKLTALFPAPQCGTRYAAFRYGCIVLAADERVGFDGAPVCPLLKKDGTPAGERASFPEIPGAKIGFRIRCEGGELRLIDYASAGKRYGSRMAAWIPLKA